ncbi:MAG: hypothetical protein JXB32_04355 [Deltaproteobacteria bacterium]|nr:hypothetical protein [Deltaproteobacteria bacterium]
MRRTGSVVGRLAGWAVTAACAVSAGCSENTGEPGDGDAADHSAEASDAPEDGVASGALPVDILVLVDYSSYTDQEQLALHARLPSLLEELAHPTDGDGDGVLDHPRVTDLRLGVVTQDLGACGLTPVETYLETFRALRPEGSNRLFVGLLVGVPPGEPPCRGSGDEMDACLALPEMQERLDEYDSSLVPSCNTSMGIAMPPVRLVRLARLLGEDAYVGSQCETDYTETIRGITAAVVARLPVE